MKTCRAELHVHTLLSACAGIEMIPPLIVETALEHGIDLIGITDHNASANISAVIEAAEGTNLTVLPGVELETAEEIHAICLFDTLKQVNSFQKLIDKNLPAYPNNEDFFGVQLIVDKEGNFLKKDDRLLSTATYFSIEEACHLVQEIGGLFIPAHVNRESNGILSQLGGIPPDLPVPILELSPTLSPEQARKKFPELAPYHLFQGGDVHYLQDFLGATCLQMNGTSIHALEKAMLEQL